MMGKRKKIKSVTVVSLSAIALFLLSACNSVDNDNPAVGILIAILAVTVVASIIIGVIIANKYKKLQDNSVSKQYYEVELEKQSQIYNAEITRMKQQSEQKNEQISALETEVALLQKGAKDARQTIDDLKAIIDKLSIDNRALEDSTEAKRMYIAYVEKSLGKISENLKEIQQEDNVTLIKSSAMECLLEISKYLESK